MTVYIIIGIIIILSILVFFILNNYNKLKKLDTMTDACEQKLTKALDLKKETINKIKDLSKNKELIKAMNIENNLDIFETEKTLFEVKSKLNKLINDKKITTKKDILKELETLHNTEDDIEGLKDYYNSKAITYNEIYYKKPFVYLYKLLKIEQKKIFNLRRIDDYEILKY